MQKVLIISYFFPPCNFVGGERTSFWAENLSKFGFYPIVITRNWNENQITITEKVKKNNFSILLEKKHEIYYLPFKLSIRDRLSNYKFLKNIKNL